MKPYPFSDFISSLYGFIYSTAKPSIPGLHERYDTDRVLGISDVSSSVTVGDSSYWDPSLKDEVTASWLASDNPRYFSLFNRSNTWDYHKYMEHIRSSAHERPPSHVGSITHSRFDPMVPGAWDTFSGVSINNSQWSHRLQNQNLVAAVGPGGKVVIKCPMSKDRVSMRPRLTEYVWDPDTDHLDIYYVAVAKPKSKGVVPISIMPYKNSIQDESEVRVLMGIYYAKLIRGEHSPEVFSVYGGPAHSQERRWAIREFISEYLEAAEGKERRKRDRKKTGFAFAYSATLHLYACDHFHREFQEVSTIEL